MKSRRVFAYYKSVFIVIFLGSLIFLFCKDQSVSNDMKNENLKYKHGITNTIVTALRDDDYRKMASILNNKIEFNIYGEEQQYNFKNAAKDFIGSELKNYLFDSIKLQKYLGQNNVFSFKDAVKSDHVDILECFQGCRDAYLEIEGKKYHNSIIQIKHKGFSYTIELFCKSDTECFIYRFGISP